MSEVAEKRIDELERELRGVQEMLYQVLKSVDEPVFVSKESLEQGVNEDILITIDEDLPREGFVFYLTRVGEDASK